MPRAARGRRVAAWHRPTPPSPTPPAQPGGGPPPHRHGFAEWFRVLDGELTLIERRDSAVHTQVLTGGEAYVAPWAVHATLNLGERLGRFEVTSRPGVMTGYAKEAGVLVPDELTPPSHRPPGPSELGAVAARWRIEFCDLAPSA
jgi:hypothetical protein